MTKKSSRYLAIETLYQLEKCSTPLPVLFQKICDKHTPSAADRSFAMNLIYGVLRQRQYLELLVSQLSRQPLKKLHPYVRQGLAVGLYQIFFLDRTPDSAAVNETVKGIKNAKVPKRLHGFVNGVLRESIRRKQILPTPDSTDENGSPILNHPQWMTARWQSHFGKDEMEAICSYNNQQQPLVLRINRQQIPRDKYLQILQAEDIEAEKGYYSADALILRGYHGPVTGLPGYEEGMFQVQGEAAQLASLLLQPIVKNGLYLDGCAGLGGKTGHLLELLEPLSANLIAVEPEKHRQDKLIINLEKRLSADQLTLFCGDLQTFCQTSSTRFSGILVDAPCSGTGVTGKHPDIRWRRTAADIEHYTKLQKELLWLAATRIAAGGVLVYATCSLEPEENNEVVHHFLEQHPSFTLTDPAPYLPIEAGKLIRQGFFHPRPSDRIDGFFAARLVRQSSDD